MSMSLNMLVSHTLSQLVNCIHYQCKWPVAQVTNIMYLSGCSAVPYSELLTKQKLPQQLFFWKP